MAKVIEEDVVVTKKVIFWTNPQGKPVQFDSIKDEDVAQDKFVSGIVERAKALQAYIKAEKEAMTQELNDYLESVAHRYAEKEWLGNAQVSDFGHTQQVCRKMGRFITFDATLQVAKQKIDRCITAWGGDSNANLVSIITATFDVNQAGKIDVQRILSLRKQKVTGDPEIVAIWNEAMEIISNSVQTEFSKAYLYFREKDSLNEWKGIPLDFSSL